MIRTLRTNENSFSNSVVPGTEGKSAMLKSPCSSVYRVDTKTYQPSDIRWLFIQVRLNCYIICKTLPSKKKKREIVLHLIMLMHAHTHPFILLAPKDVACEAQTYFRSSLLSLFLGGREATTGNTSALRRLQKMT